MGSAAKKGHIFFHKTNLPSSKAGLRPAFSSGCIGIIGGFLKDIKLDEQLYIYNLLQNLTYFRLPDMQLFNSVAENHFNAQVNAECKAEYFQV